MCDSEFLVLRHYLFDFYFCELAAVSVLLTIVLAALHLEDDYLVTLYQRVHNFNYYLCSTYSRGTNCDSSVVVNEQNLVKFNSLTSLSIFQAIDEELLALLNFELLTVNFYNCVH